MSDPAAAIEQIGVLRPGDRLILKVDRRMSASEGARLWAKVEELLPGVPVVILDAGIDAVIDRTGPDV
ncbi:hypothetical protein [Mycolicibacterium sp.]|uniref:hypothetical protein n=1 Tax=Mycolicibacterium sp. TaxID=2320850 RepID=UPI00355DB7B8